MSERHDLPVGWVMTRLDQVVSVNPKKLTPDCSPTDLFTFVPMPSVSEEFGGIDISTMRSLGEVQKGYTQFQAGDILFAKITPCMENGKIAIVPELASVCGYGSTEFHVLRPYKGVAAKWVGYCLLQIGFRREARLNMTGSAGQLRVPKPWLEGREIPVAPSPEQKRIITKIEELFSNLDAGVAALERAKENLKRYRASVLKAAVEGKLTEEWRKENPSTEPASRLLDRILTERRKKWEAEQLAKYEAKGKKPPKGWRDKYKEPSTPDTSNLPELPEGWVWATIEQICDHRPNALKAGPFGSSLKKNSYVESGYKVYGQEQVIRNDPYYGDYFITKEKYSSLNTCAVKPGDILISLVGTIGRTLVLPDDSVPGVINPRLIKASLNTELVIPKFIQLYFQSPHVAAIFKLVSHGGTMEILNMGTLKSLAFSIPPISEQMQIVRLTDQIQSLLENQGYEFSEHLTGSSRLRQAILKHAFEGKLVPQDPNDEPASELLERIKAEQKNTAGKATQQKSSRKKRKSKGGAG